MVFGYGKMVFTWETSRTADAEQLKEYHENSIGAICIDAMVSIMVNSNIVFISQWSTQTGIHLKREFQSIESGRRIAQAERRAAGVNWANENVADI